MSNIMIVGEAWGEMEELLSTHFVGPTGNELRRLCSAANMNYSECYKTNVFHFRPVDNKIETLCCSRRDLPASYPLTQLSQGKWLRPEFIPELNRLWHEIEAEQPNIIIALGNIAFWALTGETGITKNRGSIRETSRGQKMIATFHPATIWRRSDNRVIILSDLIKAQENSTFSEIVYTKRKIWIEPSLKDLYRFEELYINSSSLLAIDIETALGQITCIGFAPSAKIALVLPFWFKGEGNYWSEQNEVLARLWMKKILENPNIKKVMQNGIYDLQYLIAEGNTVQGTNDDTMIMTHVLYPSLPKALGFLGATHTNSPPWKFMNPHRADDSTKKED